MAFSYVKIRAIKVAEKGTGNAAWDKPLSDADYRTASRSNALDLSVGEVKFTDSPDDFAVLTGPSLPYLPAGKLDDNRQNIVITPCGNPSEQQ